MKPRMLGEAEPWEMNETALVTVVVMEMEGSGWGSGRGRMGLCYSHVWS